MIIEQKLTIQNATILPSPMKKLNIIEINKNKAAISVIITISPFYLK
jgi:hypothetical protein